MFTGYLRPTGDETQCSDYGSYPVKPADRPGFEWVAGAPPANAEVYNHDVTDRLGAIFKKNISNVPAELKPALYKLKVAVEAALADGEKEAARALIEEPALPPELEKIRDAMLAQL